MTSRLWLRLAAFLMVVILCMAVVKAWRADRRDRAQLNSELAATKQLLAAADARQHDRDTQLQQTLAALAAEKRTIVTPAQIVRDLPREMPLPVPIALQSSPADNAATGSSSTTQNPGRATMPSTKQNPPPTNAVIPAADLKPLYDFTLDCKACQARLATAQRDLLDEKTKSAALTQERDQALKIARGGSLLRRLGRAAKWFLIGAATGAVAAKLAH